MRVLLACAASCIVVLVLGMAGCHHDYEHAAIPGPGPAFAPVPGWEEHSRESMAGALPYRVVGCLPGNATVPRPERLPGCLRVVATRARGGTLPSVARNITPAIVELGPPPTPMPEPAEVLLAAGYHASTAPSQQRAGTRATGAANASAPIMDDGPDLDNIDPRSHPAIICPPRPMAEIMIAYSRELEAVDPEPDADYEFGVANPREPRILLEPDLLVLN